MAEKFIDRLRNFGIFLSLRRGLRTDLGQLLFHSDITRLPRRRSSRNQFSNNQIYCLEIKVVVGKVKWERRELWKGSTTRFTQSTHSPPKCKSRYLLAPPRSPRVQIMNKCHRCSINCRRDKRPRTEFKWWRRKLMKTDRVNKIRRRR